MGMSRKDFELVARTLKTEYDNAPEVDKPRVEVISVRLAEALKGTNANFDKARFLKACGVPQ